MRGVIVLDVEVNDETGFAPLAEVLQAALKGRDDVHTAYLGINECRDQVIAAFADATDLTKEAEA